MPVPALGNGDICTLPVLWDGQTDNKDCGSVTIDVQGGDLVEVKLSMACAGSFQWTCVCRSGNAKFLATNQGFYTGEDPRDLNAMNDRCWATLLESSDVQTLTIGIDHSAETLVTYATSTGNSVVDIVNRQIIQAYVPQYRISNVTLSACVIGKNYSGNAS